MESSSAISKRCCNPWGLPAPPKPPPSTCLLCQHGKGVPQSSGEELIPTISCSREQASTQLRSAAWRPQGLLQAQLQG